VSGGLTAAPLTEIPYVVRAAAPRSRMTVMAPLKAVVRNGRLVVDEPTELPEGTEIELVAVDDHFDPDERARLVRAIDDGIEDFERGDHLDGFEFIAQMRAKREAAGR